MRNFDIIAKLQLQIVTSDTRGLRRRPGRPSAARSAGFAEPIAKYRDLNLRRCVNLHRSSPLAVYFNHRLCTMAQAW
jgi:hypothetical protein